MDDQKPPIIAQATSHPMYGSICESCGQNGWPKTITRGSILTELLLWCCCGLPGLFYSIWRLTTRTKACPKCFGKMIPISSPRGKQLAKQFYGR